MSVNRNEGFLRVVVSATIVTDPGNVTTTGAALARIAGLHGALFLGITVAYFTDTRKSVVLSANNIFKLFSRVVNDRGQSTALLATPINGASGQVAPDTWEGVTTVPELDLEFDFQGVDDSSSPGHWEVILTATPAWPMCEEDFRKVSRQLTIDAQVHAL